MTKNIKQYVPIFVSSTYTDLVDYRKAVWDVFEKLQLGVSGMEIFGARSAEPLQTCVEEVIKCKVFVGIIGMRYGSVDDGSKKSFVQVEYETALENDLHILIYLIDEENAKIHPKFFDTDKFASDLKTFKELLRKKHTIETFNSPGDLATKVERDLLRLFRKEKYTIEEEKVKPSSKLEETTKLIEKFDLMPGRFRGSEVELAIKFTGEPIAVPESLCEAIGLADGEALSRSISIVSPKTISNQFSFLWKVYAEYSTGCDFLYNSFKDKEYKVVIKFAYGKEKTLVQSSYGIVCKPPIKDLASGHVFEDYIKTNPVKAIILTKVISNSS